MGERFINLYVLSHMQIQQNLAAAGAAGARGGLATETPHVSKMPTAPSTAAKSIKDVVADILTALEEVGLHGVWAVFAERPDVVVLQREGGYEVVLAGRFVKIRITTDEEFNARDIDVEYD
jgi:hypothetical protein